MFPLYSHAHAVAQMALRLAREEKLTAQEILAAELGALLHDIADWKYSGDEHAAARVTQAFLTEQGADAELVEAVVDIVQRVSFHTELGAGAAAKPVTPALACVQDADRLDAIGAIGIARCLTFGGAKNRVLWVGSSVAQSGVFFFFFFVFFCFLFTWQGRIHQRSRKWYG
jgi:uncharacterized protein